MRHSIFLNENLDRIEKQVTTVLTTFKKELEQIQYISTKIPLANVLRLASHKFETIFSPNTHYTVDFVLYCEDNKNTHARFEHFINLFKKDLHDYLKDTISSLKDYLSRQTDTKKVESFPEIEFINARDLSEEDIKAIQQKNHLTYELSKLHDNHPVFGINYFMQCYGHDQIIRNELELMQLNINTPLFNCCYEYVKWYLKTKYEL